MTTTTTSRTGRSVRAVVRAVAAVTGATLLTCAGAYAAHADEQGEAPAHGHILVLGVQMDEQGLSYRSCVDVAAGRPLPLNAHHEHFHRGTAGDALEAAGNYVVPTAPLSEWADCTAFESTFRP